ncbi:MAG: CinA family protein [Treponema sp.]|jgi:PncC family amidohydrolase|nr:CinA family protein [Treponema sp.]
MDSGEGAAFVPAAAEASSQAYAGELVGKLAAASQKVVLAESCTAGLVSDLIARIPGASQVLWGAFVCYTVTAKAAMLGLDPLRIEQYGAVSRETACAMAEGALGKSGADIAAAVTGLAGPEGDGSAVPVGTVWIACARRGGAANAAEFHFAGSRNEVRSSAAAEVINALLKYL